jgi:hypothetical protein
MAAYLQLGHNSWNLFEEPDIGNYSGMVLSPVNDSPADVAAGLLRLGEQRPKLDVILDPQLYNPAVDKGLMDQWAYFPSDFETANHADAAWWIRRGIAVANQGAQLGVNAVCSPALFPKTFSDDYYGLMVEIADATHQHAKSLGLDTLVTAIISLRDLTNPARAYAIASILSRSRCDRIYLTFLNEDVKQQREPLSEPSGLPTAVHLIRLLSRQMRVHVAFASHDMVLWKCAGATDVSSGKFMNLRRFSPGRWEEEKGGGQQAAYWTEGSLFTLLRSADVERLRRDGWFDGRDLSDNPASLRIMEFIQSGSKKLWVKESWLQYLRWIANAEAAWHGRPDLAMAALEESHRLWGDIVNVRQILFQDWFNEHGTHVKNWLNAAREGGKR